MAVTPSFEFARVDDLKSRMKFCSKPNRAALAETKASAVVGDRRGERLSRQSQIVGAQRDRSIVHRLQGVGRALELDTPTALPKRRTCPPTSSGMTVHPVGRELFQEAMPPAETAELVFLARAAARLDVAHLHSGGDDDGQRLRPALRRAARRLGRPPPGSPPFSAAADGGFSIVGATGGSAVFEAGGVASLVTSRYDLRCCDEAAAVVAVLVAVDWLATVVGFDCVGR